jgi:FPC/CPF motif-containing protein YcgG
MQATASKHPRTYMAAEPPPLTHLLTAAGVEQLRTRHALSPWAESAYAELVAKVADPAFPCTFGTVALRKGDILTAFIETQDPATLRDDLRERFAEYTARMRTLDPVTASLHPLAIFLPPPSDVHTIGEYFAFGWSLLQWLHDHDPAPWPDRIPRDPDDPAWSYCFGGIPLFVNFKTPAHALRRSRRMATAYLLLVQTRDGFDVVAGDTPQGRRARNIIRQKLAAYDPLPPYPELAHFGTATNREWKQYFVPDDNRPPATRCPFTPNHSPQSGI